MPQDLAGAGARDSVEALISAVMAASRLLTAISLRSLAGAEQQVTPAQFRALLLLATQGETNLAGLAERLAVNPSTAFRMVDRLAEGGLVARRANPARRREILLRLTLSGQRLADEVTARRREKISAILLRMTPRSRAELLDALQAFTEAGAGPAGNRPGPGPAVPARWHAPAAHF